jgi:hypothetical protein
MIGMIGPKDHWQAEMEKCSKSGLIYLAESLLTVYLQDLNRDQLLRNVKNAKRVGRFEDKMRSWDRRDEDPDRWEEQRLQRRLRAVKAARKRKKERKSK